MVLLGDFEPGLLRKSLRKEYPKQKVAKMTAMDIGQATIGSDLLCFDAYADHYEAKGDSYAFQIMKGESYLKESSGDEIGTTT